MTLLGKIVYIGSVLLTVGYLASDIRRARNYQPIILPAFSAALVFLSALVLVQVFGLSAFHVVWLFPVSLVLGIALVSLPSYTRLIMRLLSFFVFLGKHGE